MRFLKPVILESSTFQEVCEWDAQHGKVEKYSKNGRNHLGEFDPDTGEQTKPADPRRSVEK